MLRLIKGIIPSVPFITIEIRNQLRNKNIKFVLVLFMNSFLIAWKRK